MRKIYTVITCIIVTCLLLSSAVYAEELTVDEQETGLSDIAIDITVDDEVVNEVTDITSDNSADNDSKDHDPDQDSKDGFPIQNEIETVEKESESDEPQQEKDIELEETTDILLQDSLKEVKTDDVLPEEMKNVQEEEQVISSEVYDEEDVEEIALLAESEEIGMYGLNFRFTPYNHVLNMRSDTVENLLSPLGIHGTLTNAVSSNPECFSVSDITGSWVLSVNKAFAGEETLTVTVDGTAYTVLVTTTLGNPSGTCGNNTTWRLDPGMDALTGESLGYLSIFGTGNMEDYDGSMNIPPWYEIKDLITSIQIYDGVTAIGSYAFSGCSNLRSVVIPASITQIHYSAFDGCISLADVSYRHKESLWNTINIGSGNECLMTAQIQFAEDETGTWGDCSYVLTVDGILTISGSGAMEDGYIKGDSYHFPYWNYSGIAVKEVIISEGITHIGSFIFTDNSSRITKVTIPKSVTSIGSEAFLGSSNLAEVYYGGSEISRNGISIGNNNDVLGTAIWHYAEDNLTGWQSINGKAYYFNANGEKLTSWQKIDNSWFFFDTDGVMQTGWVKSGNKWYYMNSGGNMATGWQQISGKWYYLNGGGDMVTGWQQIGGKWYYFNGGGDMVTGWQQIGGKWYYFNCGGDMVTGWLQIGGKWYYLNGGGDMVAAWKQIGGKWYYFNGGGDMVTGWKQIGGKWYYFNGGGDMVTGWKQTGGKWYYFNGGGDMVTGWKQTGGKWYYFNGGGDMVTGNHIISGVTYRFNSSGVLIS